MGEIALHNEEKLGLAAAVVLHGALVAVLLMQTVRSEVSVFPERMTVSLATEVGLEAASPDPVSESRASIAPTLDDNPAPAPDQAKPEPATRVAPVPPKPATRTATSQPAPTRDRSRPDRTPPRQAATTPPKTTPKSGGGSRIGDDFLEGKGSSTTTSETRAPAATFGAKEAADLRSAISRQIKKNWTAPNGVEAELLVSEVSWKLNSDGTLKGRPTCRTKPESITTSNRPQAALHCERAIRAVQLGDFSNLPKQFYSRWDDLVWQFDRRL
ncbi:energy transducer TonB [Porphyrobacter sp. ULC335]|uniref:energy transducer TonB n=1 Tax=Porphyrobacter sp. ULC335 TaxID=2854260 RepID=UPI002220D124|nr:energy transducer TonB [Porphyrobacter sp. ULC335]UYV17043.1 energy transducer TonB [Porphyrobacter sp. ULC335]